MYRNNCIKVRIVVLHKMLKLNSEENILQIYHKKIYLVLLVSELFILKISTNLSIDVEVVFD